jgi:hypothetical protein
LCAPDPALQVGCGGCDGHECEGACVQ